MGGKKPTVVILLLVGLALSFPLSTATQSGITVTGADSVLNTSSTYSSDLVTTTLSIGPRVAVEYAHSTDPHTPSGIPAGLQDRIAPVPARVAAEYANSTDSCASSEMPTGLQDRVDLVLARVVIQYANSTGPRALTEIPTELQDRIGPVSDRVAVEYASSTSPIELAYPVELMNDNQPPEITQVDAVGNMITWVTDEFATSTVLYGTQSGVYSQTVSDPLYAKQHKITLTGLTPGTTYYYKVSSTDRSGNTATSSEHSFTAQLYVYLPLVMQNN